MAATWTPAFALELAAALGSARQALNVFALRLAREAGFSQDARALRARTAGALPPFPLTAAARKLGRQVLEGPAPDAHALSAIAEALLAGSLSRHGRRGSGLYFTPPDLAARVVEVALRHGHVARDRLPSVIDPCAGAGAFLVAACRALGDRGGRVRAALACSGADLNRDALAAARAAVALEAGSAASTAELAELRFDRHDSLFHGGANADLLVSNPPYGHIDRPAEREQIAARYPALRGGEIDRYAAFLLRSVELVKPGGTAALLVPDTWMTNSRGGALRGAVLDAAELSAVVDLGKPFASAKDTRVQAVVLVRRASARARPCSTFTARLRGQEIESLAPLGAGALRATAPRGWQPYRTRRELELCDALERNGVPLGVLCSVGYGLRTGDNGRHVLRARERDAAVPLLGGEDVVPFAVRWKPKFLRASSLPQLGPLADKQRGRPRVAIQRIRTNSQKPWARWLEAAMCPAETVCLDSLSTLACEDDELLWALLGVVGSVALDRVHRLRTTDVNVKPAVLRELPAPRALLDPPRRRRLAELVRARAAQAAEEAKRPQDGAPPLERQIDTEVYALYGLSRRLIEESERGFWGDRASTELPRLGGT